MGTSLLNILMIDDSEDDTLLLLHELQKDFDLRSIRVDTAEELLSALKNRHWDVIISDYVMPGFSGLEALKLVQNQGLDIPFIIVSGKVGEDVAVDAMRAGAHDYVLKGNLARLAPAIRRELQEAVNRQTRKQAEESLRAAEARFRSLVEQSLSGIYIIQNNRFPYVNPRFAEMFGYTQAEVINLPSALDVVAEVSREEARLNIEKRLSNKTSSIHYSLKGLKKNGELIDLEAHGTTSEINGETAIIGTVIDVTEQKRTQENLRKLYHAVEQSPVSIMITDKSGLIDYVNPKFTALTGYAADEALGRNARVLKSDRMPAEVYQYLWKTIIAGQDWHGEMLNRKKDGELFWERASVSAIKDSEGEITHFVAVEEDITDQVRAEERERRNWKLSEAMATASLRFLETGSLNRMAQVLVDSHASLTGSSTALLYDLLPNGDARILAVSAADDQNISCTLACNSVREKIESSGYYILNRTQCLLFAPVDQKMTVIANGVQQLSSLKCGSDQCQVSLASFLGTPLMVGNEVVGMICVANRPDGFSELEQRELEAFAQTAALAIYTARGEIEHKKAMEQLRQAQKMEAVGRLAGGVAHDFNNLLTVINGYSTILLQDMNDEDPLREEIEQILKAGERAADLTHQLLAFSRRQILEPRVIDLNCLVRNLKKMLRRLIGENIDLTTRLNDDIGRIKADPGQCEQILLNLVVNARDAIEGNGIITIETENVELDYEFVFSNPGSQAGRFVLLAVHDNGSGMTEEIRRKLFEPFFTTKEQGKGTGLGLATVYGIVKQSGGYIQAISEPGDGSTFKIYFPLVETLAEPDIMTDVDENLPRGTATILIVEDEEGVLSLIVRTLSARGYHVLHASSPLAALDIFERNRDSIDLLVTDVVMPGLSGPKLAEVIGESRPDLPVIFISGYTTEALGRHGATADKVNFIMKPFTPADLASRVHEILANRSITS